MSKGLTGQVFFPTEFILKLERQPMKEEIYITNFPIMRLLGIKDSSP